MAKKPGKNNLEPAMFWYLKKTTYKKMFQYNELCGLEFSLVQLKSESLAQCVYYFVNTIIISLLFGPDTTH